MISTVSRRQFLHSAALIGGVVMAPRLASSQPAVKVGTAVLGDYSLAGPIIIALERGYFRQEGVSAEFVPFRGGPDLVKGVVAGEIMIGATGSTDILVFREAGTPIKMIATHTEGNHFTFNVAPDIEKVSDLKGKAIGVTRPGAATWVFARMLAKNEGWDADRDVKIVGLGGLDAQLAALARREIHAFVWGDGGAVPEVQGKSKILLRLDKVTPKWISQIQYASEEGIKKNAEEIRKSMRAIFRAMRLMKDKPTDVAELVAKKLNWSPEAVGRAHKISGGLMSADGTMSVEALQSMQDTLLDVGVLKKKLPLEEHYTKEFTPVRL